MKKLDIIKPFFLLGAFCLMISCKNIDHQTEYLKQDSSFVSHKFTIDGKTIHFSLPTWYTDKGMEQKRYLSQYVDNLLIRQSEFVFFSTKNDNSFFSLYIKDDSLDSYWSKYSETIILDSVVPYMVNNYNMVHPGTTLIEKKWDTNKHPYYFLMSSNRYSEKMGCEDPICNLYKSDSIQLDFMYLTYFGKKGYFFTLSSIESTKEFSYEEKRRVLESITIE